MRYQVIVIGAGMVGTSIAWHLQNTGTQVLMLDKRPPGSETSYGNAGLIQREAIHTRPFPRQLVELIRVLPNHSTDIRYRWPAVLRYRQALLKYWQYSSPAEVSKIDQEWQTLIEHCTSEHQEMITSADAEHLIRRVGWIELHRSEDKFNNAVKLAGEAVEQGVTHKVLTVAELQKMEPNVDFKDYVGGIHWLNSWQVTNPGELVKAYAKDFEAKGGAIAEHSVMAIEPFEGGWKVSTDDGVYYSDDLVVAAGPWSADLIEPLGYKIPLFPMRGYHQHFEVTQKNMINHSMIDMDIGFAMGPMQQGIRITTGAEMTLMDASKNFGQLTSVMKHVKKVLPLENAVESEAWCGSRPCMPDMKPVIGAADKHEHLWFAFGHSFQGFTLGPVTGRVVQQLMQGQEPLVDLEPFSSKRFGDQ